MNFSAALVEQFSSLAELLAWIVGAGGAMWLFGKLEARVLENWIIWHNFPLWVKKSVPAVVAALFSFGANALITIDVEQYLPASLQYIIMAGINYYMSQLEYSEIKDSSYAESTRAMAKTYLG